MRQRINPLVNLGRTSPVAQRVGQHTYIAAAKNPNIAGAATWWLPAGIVAADVVAAYQPRGADSASDALVNLALPGTRDATYHTTAIRWDRSKGWWNEVATTVAAGAVRGPALGANYTVAISLKAESLAGGRWIDQTGGVSTFYFLSTGGQLQARLGGATDLLNTTGGLDVRTLILADHALYENGASIGTVGGTTELATNMIPVIGNANTFNNAHRGEIHAVAIFNKTLTAPQAAALHAAMRLI